MDISVLVLSYSSSVNYGFVKKIFVNNLNLNYNFSIINVNNNIDVIEHVRSFLDENQGKYSVITTNNIMSNISIDTFNSYLETIINNNQNGEYTFDICYVSKWLDNCFSYSDQYNLDDLGTTLVKTTGPKGFETLLFSPSGTSKFLSRHIPPFTLPLNEYLLQDINEDYLTAITFSQSLLVYNPLNAKTVNDYVRTATCQNIPINSNDQQTSNLYFFYFILIIIIVFILAWLIFKLSPFLRSSMDDYPFLDNPIKSFNRPYF